MSILEMQGLLQSKIVILLNMAKTFGNFINKIDNIN